jgi:hypothetical protein
MAVDYVRFRVNLNSVFNDGGRPDGMHIGRAEIKSYVEGRCEDVGVTPTFDDEWISATVPRLKVLEFGKMFGYTAEDLYFWLDGTVRKPFEIEFINVVCAMLLGDLAPSH